MMFRIVCATLFVCLIACDREPSPDTAGVDDSNVVVRLVDSVNSKAAAITAVERPDLARYFQQAAADSGAFVLFDISANQIIRYNPTRCATGYLPASTFKIFNSLVAFETGVASDTNFSLQWDSVERFSSDWNRDQTIAEAFRNSTVWFYQELARRIGQQRMQDWVSREGYGNGNIQGGIDKFWLKGKLRISPNQQVEFLRRLFDGNVGFSERTTGMVKQMMLKRDTLNYRLRAKTGWADMKDRQIGWIVGWVERPQGGAVFALNLESRDPKYPMVKSRMAALEGILKELTMLPKEW